MVPHVGNTKSITKTHRHTRKARVHTAASQQQLIKEKDKKVLGKNKLKLTEN